MEEGGGFSWGGVEGWGEKAYNCNRITIKINKNKRLWVTIVRKHKITQEEYSYNSRHKYFPYQKQLPMNTRPQSKFTKHIRNKQS